MQRLRSGQRPSEFPHGAWVRRSWGKQHHQVSQAGRFLAGAMALW